MTYKVERCWGGYFRVSGPNGMWAHIANKDDDRWDRSHATEAKNYISYFHGTPRRNIRFYHV